SIAVHLPGDFSGDPTTEGTGDSITSELGDRSDPTEGHGVASTDSGSPTTDNPLRSTTLSTPLHLSLCLTEVQRRAAMGHLSEEAEAKKWRVARKLTMAKEGNAMEHLIKDLEELSPVASSDQKEAIKISESSKELSKTMDVWVNGKGVKASSDGNGEKEFMISPSRFSPLQDIDEEKTCLEGGGTEVEEGEFRENIVDGKKEMELQMASTSRQQGTVTRQLRGRVTGDDPRPTRSK
ncbi:hypothetical protein HID58_073886, partial [Brassica napus]